MAFAHITRSASSHMAHNSFVKTMFPTLDIRPNNAKHFLMKDTVAMVIDAIFFTEESFPPSPRTF